MKLFDDRPIEWMSEWMNEWMNERTNERTNEWMGEVVNNCQHSQQASDLLFTLRISSKLCDMLDYAWT